MEDSLRSKKKDIDSINEKISLLSKEIPEAIKKIGHQKNIDHHIHNHKLILKDLVVFVFSYLPYILLYTNGSIKEFSYKDFNPSYNGTRDLFTDSGELPLLTILNVL